MFIHLICAWLFIYLFFYYNIHIKENIENCYAKTKTLATKYFLNIICKDKSSKKRKDKIKRDKSINICKLKKSVMNNYIVICT